VLLLGANENYVAATSVKATGFQRGRARLLRTLISIVIMAVGAVVFSHDPSDFSQFSYCGLAGTTIVAGAFFLVGLALWLGE
jgi:hypothetical protein